VAWSWRVYDESALRRVGHIAELVRNGLTVQGIKQLEPYLEQHDLSACDDPTLALEPYRTRLVVLDDRLAELQRHRDRLIRLVAGIHKPPQLSFVHAAALPVAGWTAWDSLEKLGLTKGETLLINGIGGGVGVMAAQLARNRGAAVFGVGSESKRPLVESFGATLVPYDSPARSL
jgi:DNA-binding transcriptional MerR regulator